MNCPVCENSRMREVEKNGILIDVCPSCKGVWLDRGELDKLMSDVREVRSEYNEWHYRDADDDDRRRMKANPPSGGGYPPASSSGHGYDNRHGDGYGSHKKKKKSVLDVFGDLFD
ncbi:zf-TFIIB domain-containing protein [Paenibacillus rhizovicinus]|uniref:Zf-TFIIB domain-containing protein n=1 Tax=Paenibacillus rhizovicinus TaxID=2704463 RepID=A0A6C0P5B9_9BACL|nr:zf-TFIIB domain-containing protein [Paenibacillus rhizovicinus]QHW33677.1 zf-TFIIB domain-containing protein [Paenibacillus rhizovicinus]